MSPTSTQGRLKPNSDDARQDPDRRRGDLEQRSGGGEHQPERDQRSLADAPDHWRRGQPGQHRAQPLKRDEHAHERRRLVQTRPGDREHGRLAEAEPEHGAHRRDGDLAQPALPARWRMPALSSARQRWVRGLVGCVGSRSESAHITGTAKLAASRMTSGCGPTSAYSPAPVIGATRLSVPWMVRSAPLASASRSPGRIVLSSADWVAANVEYDSP